MKFYIKFTFLFLLISNILSGTVAPNHLQANNIGIEVMDGGFVDIMQVKNGNSGFTIGGTDCGITQITIINYKGIQMIPVFNTADYSFSLHVDTNSWPSGKYTVIVEAENNCSTTKEIQIP